MMICRFVWTRWGLARFEREVNDVMKHGSGWKVEEVRFDHRLLRTLCVAIFVR